MESYTGFAQVYDTFMDNVPYDDWVKYLHQLLKEYGVDSGLVLDLGCGTGNITRRLRTLGYDMIGLDSSTQMLEIARQRMNLKAYFILIKTCGVSYMELYQQWLVFVIV